jgi:hypothetical protein
MKSKTGHNTSNAVLLWWCNEALGSVKAEYFYTSPPPQKKTTHWIHWWRNTLHGGATFPAELLEPRKSYIISKDGENRDMQRTVGAMLRFKVLGSSPPTTSILLDCLVIMYRVYLVNNIALKHPDAPINHLILRNTYNTIFSVASQIIRWITI